MVVESAARELEAAHRAWGGFFQHAGIGPVRVSYEELAADYQETALRVLDSIAPPPSPFGLRRLRRQFDATTER